VVPARIWIRREESLAHKEDGRIVEYATPVACDCCGKECTVRVAHMSNGARMGRECAGTVELCSDVAAGQRRPLSAESARCLYGARNPRVIAYLTDSGVIS
jgi:hypothetical protein